MTENRHLYSALTPTNPYAQPEDKSPDVCIGHGGEYRLIFVGSPVRVLFDAGIEVGGARIEQTDQPLQYQTTDVSYIPGPIPIEHHSMHRAFTRPGQLLTLVTVPFIVPESGINALIAQCQRKAEEALAAVVMVLDERLSDRRIGEMVLISSPKGPMCVDVTRGVRTFDARLEGEYPTKDALLDLARADLGANDSSLRSALRLYLRGTEKRLTQDGFVLLAAAVDELAGRRRLMKAHDIRDALVEAGERADNWPLARLGLLSTVRGTLIHNGMADFEQMYKAWYDLEEVLRILLRHRAGIELGWPSRVPMYEGPVLWQAVKDVENKPAGAGAASVMRLFRTLFQRRKG